MMVAFDTLIYEKEGCTGHVTLNRPGVLNVFNTRMRDELYEVLEAVRDDPEVQVCIFSGAGDRAFCAGADLTEFLTAPSPVEARRVRWQRDVWGLFLDLPKPIIAALHGYVFGSGLEIALCCDIRVASDDVQFSLPEGGLGIIPAAGGTQTLPRTVGRAALEVLLTGRRLGADEAMRMKLVNRVVKKECLLEEAGKLAGKVASFSPLVVSLIKRAVMQGMELPLNEAIELEEVYGKKLAAASC